MKWQVPLLVVMVCLGGMAQAQVWRVDPTAPGAQDGLTWATAFHTIQPAIDAAYAAGGGQVWVAGGTIGSPRVYNELRTEAWGAPALVTGSLVMKDNVQVYGGFSGYNGGAGRQETQLSQRNWYLYPAVVDGSTARAGSPAYHVVVFGRSSAPTVNARLDGFTITGGNASGVAGDYHTWRGGGIYVWQSQAIIEHCFITGCAAAVSGGGIANESGPAGPSNSIIRSVLLVNNVAGRGLDTAGNPIRGGGGVFNNNADAQIIGCTIYGCTLTDNATGLFGLNSGGVYNWEAAPIINNCIFRANNGAVVSEGSLGNTEQATISYTLAGTLLPGTGNIGGVDPLLDANYVPQAGSPVLNVGDPALTGTDNRGVNRQVNGRADMGAMEYSPNGPAAVCNSATVDLTVTNQITNPATISASTAEAGIWYEELENKTFSCSDIPSSTLQLTVYDVLGRSASCTATINVTETEPPVVTLNGSGSLTLECGATYVEQGATATDNCDANVTITITGSVNTGVPGVYTLTYTGTDDVGNTASVQRIVNVQDTVPPVVTISGGNTLTAECGVSLTLPAATWTDTCAGSGAATVSDLGGLNPANPALGVYSVVYSGSDGYNSATATLTVTVVDTTAPVITLNGVDPMTVECGSAFTDPGATASDQCVGSVAVTASGTVNTAVPGSYTITYTADDGNGNTATATRVMNVVDTTGPVIVLNGNNPETVECGTTFTDPGAAATDACEGAVAVSPSGSVNAAVPGTYIITYTASDSQANSSVVTRTVDVVDTTAPVITIPGPNPVYVPLNGSFTAPVATATDACDGNLGSVNGTGTVDTSVVGTYTVTYTISDAASNVAVATLTVEVLANLPPVISILGDNPVTLECGDEYTDAGATASDYEDGDLTAAITVSGLPPAGPLSPGSWTVTYSVTDSNNQTVTAQRVVNVVDTSVPVVTIDGGNALAAECGVALTLPSATASDPCAGTLAATITDLAGLDVNNPVTGVYNVVYSANDGYNTGTATLVVTVSDTVAPVLTVPGPNPVYVHTGDPYTPPTGTAVDACDGTFTVTPTGTLDLHTPGVYTLVYTATDAAANESDYTLTVNVADDFPPEIALVGGTSVLLNCGDVFTTAGVATATDIEDGDLTALVTATGEPPSGPLGPGSWTVTYAVTDSFGNTTTVNQAVTVQNNCTLAVLADGPTVIDAIAGDTVSMSVTVTGAVGSVSYQWYREDGSKAWQAIPGANGNTLSFNPVALTDAGQYQCEVSDAVTSVNSPTFTLNVSNGVPVAGPLGLLLLAAAVAGVGVSRRRGRSS